MNKVGKRLVGCFLLGLCGLAFAGEIVETYEARIKSGEARRATEWRRENENAVTLGKGGLEEIGLERTSFMGHGGSVVVIQADGRFRYFGDTGTAKAGHFIGKVDLEALKSLAAFIQESAYLALEDEYTSGSTDQAAAYTAVTWNGRRKIVRHYGNTGPRKLWAVEQMIDKLVADAKWEPAPAPAPAKPAADLPAASKSEARAALIKTNARCVGLAIAYVGQQEKPYYQLRLAVPPMKDVPEGAFDLRASIDEKQVARLADALAKDGFLDRATDHALRLEGPGYSLLLTLDTAAGPTVFHEDLGFNLTMLRHLDALLPALDDPAQAKLQTLLTRLSGERRIWEGFERNEKARVDR